MRVTCPHCNKEVQLDDKSAETPVPCPQCGNIFTAPSLMMALPDEPKPAPAPTPITIQVTPAPAAVSVPATPKVETTATSPQMIPAESCRITLRKSFITWVGPIALVILFILTFANWVGAYPNGHDVYTQSAWQVMAGGFTTDAAGEEVFGRENDLRNNRSFSFTMLMTLLLLIAGAIIAGLDLAEEYVTFTVPDIVQTVWPHRLKFLAILSMIIFGFLSGLCVMGLGMEATVPTMAEQVVRSSEAKLPADAPAETTKMKTTRELRIAREVAQLNVKRTIWWRIAYTASAIAVLGFGLEMWLRNRGRRPEPVLEFHY